MDRRRFIFALLLAPGMAVGRVRDARTRRCRWLKTRVRLLDERLRKADQKVTTRRLRGRRQWLAKQLFRECR